MAPREENIADDYQVPQGNAKKGAKLFKRHCIQCHSIHPLNIVAAINSQPMGPTLWDVYMRTSGTQKGSTLLSQDLVESGLIWNDANLMRYMRNPSSVIDGISGMTFRGIADYQSPQSLSLVMIVVPIFRERLVVDVIYDRAAVFSGSALRCIVEVRGPPGRTRLGGTSGVDPGSSLFLKFLSFQLIGSVSALRPGLTAALQATVNNIDEKIQQRKAHCDQFSTLLIEDASRRYNVSDHPNLVGNKNETTEDKTLSSGGLSDLCYDPPCDPSTVIFMKSFPTIICQDEVFTSSTIRIFGFECLLPPFLPPSFVGTVYKYTYYLSVAAVISPLQHSKQQNISNVEHIKLPVHVVGPASTGMMPHLHQSSPLILDSKFFASPSKYKSNKKNVVVFDFSGKAWEGGSHLCQSFYRPGVASALGPSITMSKELSVLSLQSSGSSNIESETLLWLMSLQSNSLPSLISNNEDGPTTNKSSQEEGVKQTLPQWSGYGPLDDFWSDDKAEISAITEGIPRIQEVFRISHEGLHVVSLQLLGLHPCLPRPPQLHSKFKKLPSPSHGLGCPLGSSFVVGFDFTEAKIETLEIHAAIVRFEASLQAPSPQPKIPFFTLTSATTRPNDEPLLHRHTVTEIKESVLHAVQHSVEIKVPTSLTPTFETDLVSVAYSVIFTLFCGGISTIDNSDFTTSPSLESIIVPSTRCTISAKEKFEKPIMAFKSRDMVELQWTVALTILPPVSDDTVEYNSCMDLPPRSLDTEDPLGYYSATSACWSMSEGYKRLHRGLLL